MLKEILPALAGAALLATAAAATAQTAASPLGVWINDEGRGGIEISPCGDKLCGKVVWLKDTKDAKGCGLQILGDLRESGAGTWDSGWIYSPDNDRKYDVELKPLGNDRLSVVGYAGIKLFSKSMIWTRAPADLKRCTTTEASVTPSPSAKTDEPAPPGSAPATQSAQKPDGSTGSTDSAKVQPQPPANGDTHSAPPPAPRTAEKKHEKTERSRTARVERDCTIRVPYVTITYPCKDRD
jgi:uncharacterized protein (DUF2147 family)